MVLWAIIKISIIKGEDENEYGVYFSSPGEETIFDVSKFGAVGDGETDDTRVILTNPSSCYAIYPFLIILSIILFAPFLLDFFTFTIQKI